MSRLYLIRHAKPASSWGSGDADPELDESGRLQALSARDWLLSLPEVERPVGVVSSPLRRCRETALPTAEALGAAVEVDPAFGEIPTPRDLPAAQRPEWLRRAFEGTWREIQGDLDYEIWRRRIASSLLERGKTAVFSHYVAINAVVSLLSGEDKVLSFQPDHASITVLEIAGGRLTLVAKGREAATSVL